MRPPQWQKRGSAWRGPRRSRGGLAPVLAPPGAQAARHLLHRGRRLKVAGNMRDRAAHVTDPVPHGDPAPSNSGCKRICLWGGRNKCILLPPPSLGRDAIHLGPPRSQVAGVATNTRTTLADDFRPNARPDREREMSQ